jgi:hypothetical protein
MGLDAAGEQRITGFQMAGELLGMETSATTWDWPSKASAARSRASGNRAGSKSTSAR